MLVLVALYELLKTQDAILCVHVAGKILTTNAVDV